MACIVKVGNKFENLSGYNTYITDKEPNSEYFRVSKFADIFTAGKNLFLLEGSECLRESTELKIEIVDADGGTIYVEPGRGVPDYYEGNSVVLSSHVYETTPVGPAKITILGELKDYFDEDGLKRPVPEEWVGAYNVKWEKNFFINKNENNKTPVIFYKKPSIDIEEVESVIVEQTAPEITQSGSVIGLAETPPVGTNLDTWRAGTLYRLEKQSGNNFKSAMDENIIKIPSLNYEATIKEVINSNTLLVDKPFVDSENNIINNSTPVSFETTFTDFAARTTVNSAVTASFGKIKLKNLDTFTGNVDKMKIYKKSRSDVGDFKFQDEIKIVAGNLLRDPLVPGSELDGGFGKLSAGNVERYWTTSSLQISGSSTNISFDDDLLYESIKINVPTSSQQTESIDLLVDTNFDLYENVDYELNFKTLVSGSVEDIIIGETTVVSESYARTYFYQFDSSQLPEVEPTYVSESSYSGIETPNSSSVNLTKPLVYDDTRLSFFDTPQNSTGSVYTAIPSGFAYTHSHDTTLTFDTTSGDWGTNSRVQTDSSNKTNIVARSGSFCGEFNLVVWLDSGSFTLPTGGSPTDVRTIVETYDSGSTRIALFGLENIGTDAKFYYKHSSTELDELESFRTSTEYSLENIDTNDYNDTSVVSTWDTGSQTIIDYNDGGYHYVHIDYRTLRNIEPLNATLVPVKRLDSLDGDILYGTTYEINSMNFDTGDIVFSHEATDGTLSGVVSLVNGQAVLTIGSDTTTGYIVELDFEQGIMVFTGELDFTELVPAQRSYDLYDLFDLSGSNWISTGSTELFVPRVPPRGGDYIYGSSGYPYSSTEFSDRNFLTTEFTSPSSSDDNFTKPLQIPYIFRNDNDVIENVYVEQSDQIYVVSSISSSSDINNTDYIYDQDVVFTGWFPTGSLTGSVHVDDTLHSDTYKTSLANYNSLITATNPISSSIGQFNIVLVTDSGSTAIPTNTGSVEFQIEYYQSASQELRAAIALRNVETDAMFFYNNSATSQSVLQSYSGSTNIILDSIDSGDFTSTPTWFLSTGSQAIFDLQSGSNSHFIYIDYRTNRTSEPLNANLHEITAISDIGTNSFSSLKAREIFPLSGSTTITGSVTSTDYYTSQLPLIAGNSLYNLSDYPFVTTATDGTYITDDFDITTDVTIPDTTFNIPYVFDTVDGIVENVLVERLDSIYTASSVNGTDTTTFTEPAVFVSRSLKESDTIVPKTINAYITGSYPSGGIDNPFYESLVSYTATSAFNSRQQIQHLFTMPYSGSGKLGFSFRGDGWQIASVDLKPSQDASFSPKVFDVLDEQDRTLPVETFDYRFELYDVNNNYIPVELKASKEFSGGNKVSDDVVKLLTFETDRTAFRFYSGSIANPNFQQTRFNFSKTNALTGSITFESSAFDKNGNYIDPSTYSGDYPGGLTNITETNALLTVANFSGSDTTYDVGSIVYTASVDDTQEFETIFRLEDGITPADLIVNNDRSVITFKQSDGNVNPSTQISTITVKRKNLATNTETVTANSASVVGNAPPLTLLSDDSTTGVQTYFLSGSSLDINSGSLRYEFSSSDSFGVQVDNSTTITPISFLGGVVLYLSNERGVLPAFYSGIIPSSSYVYTSGSTKLYVEGDEITYDNNGGNNTYRITGVTGSGITPNEVAPTTNNYGGVPGTMLTESSSLEVNVDYTDELGTTYFFGREANFNIVREGEQGQPGLSGSNGPGLVFTGLWTGSRDYSFNESDALSRADAVLYNDIFYLAITGSGPGTDSGAQTPPNATYWEELGSGSRFVAAELAIFSESYVQNTINIGTNNSGSTSAANITIAGGTNYPWISIDQSADTGTQGYNVGSGIFLGINGNTGTGSFSIESGLFGDELLWDGNSLTIRGSIQFSNVPDLITETLITSSLYTSGALDSASLAQSAADQVNTDLADVISGTTALEDGDGNTFIDEGFIYSPKIGGTSGYISNVFGVGENGIRLAAESGSFPNRIYIGTGSFNDSNTPFYVDDSGSVGRMSLGDKLVWDGEALSINGNVTLGDGSDLGNNLPAGTISGSDQLPDGLISGSEQFPSGLISGSEQFPSGIVSASGWEYAMSFGPDALFPLASISTPTKSGLHLSNTNLGYYYKQSGSSGDGEWKSYMDNSGNFYLGGEDGAMAWNGSQLKISGEITASAGKIAGFDFNGTELSTENNTFLLETGLTPFIEFRNDDSASVVINNTTTLTPTTVITPPTFSGAITTTTTNTDYDYVLNSQTFALSVSDSTIHTKDNNVQMYINSAALDGISATIAATITGGGPSSKHIISEFDDVFATMDFHEVDAILYAYLYKGSSAGSTNTLVSTKTFNISTNSLSDTDLSISNSYTARFNVLLENNTYYEIRTGIGHVASSVDIFGVSNAEPSDMLTLTWYTPKLTTPTVTVAAGADNQFTEICRGGFQVVSSANKKIIAEIDSNASTPALSVTGDFDVTGNISTSGDIDAGGNISAYSTSDSRLKQNVKLIPDALEKLNEISGVSFDWKEGFSDVHKFEGHDIGVIAQEIEYILPEIVQMNKSHGYRGVKYEKLTPLLIEAVKELSKKVNKLEKQIKQLKDK